MAQARTIELLLSNGSLSGLIRAELSKWSGVLLVSPRESYEMLSNQPEASYTGIYLLLSEDKVYIGQASELLKRTKEHDHSTLRKEWWNRVLLLSTTTDWLNRSHIDYLETKLIDKAKSAGSLDMDNKKSGNSYKINPFEEAKLNDYIEGALLLIELIGISVFVTKSDNKPPKKTPPVKPADPQRSTIDKKKATELFEEKGVLKNPEFLTYASLQKEKFYYWANSNPDCLGKNWFIILNDVIDKVLYLLNVPKNILTVTSENINGLKVRIDKNLLDLKINYENFVENNSGISFENFIVDKIKY